jgi:hypothetical protein
MAPQPERSVRSASGRPAGPQGEETGDSPASQRPPFSQEVRKRAIARAPLLYALTCPQSSTTWAAPLVRFNTCLPPGHLYESKAFMLHVYQLPHAAALHLMPCPCARSSPLAEVEQATPITASQPRRAASDLRRAVSFS